MTSADSALTVIALAMLAGGLAVYIYFAARPQAYDEPRPVYGAGLQIQQVAGYGFIRARLGLAFAALVACLFFLLGFLLNR